MAHRKGGLAALVAVLALALPARAAPHIVAEEAMVGSDPGVSVYVRNKHPDGVSSYGPDRTLIFVHGATYPASTSFDLPLGGASWMDRLAACGFDVYLVDVRGYGRSTRPPAMAQPPKANPPVATTGEAIRDLGAAVDYVLHRRGLERLDVMGWSWGTTTAAGFAAAHPGKVNRLVLYAPLWIIEGGPAVSAGPGPLGAYRLVTQEAAYSRWLAGVPEQARASLIPDDWFQRWADATWATDPEAARHKPAALRAPNGVLLDIDRYWRKGHPTYDPAAISAPTLIVQGEWDHDTPPYMSHALFPLLTRAAWKQYVMIGGGTHTIIMERNRDLLFEAVQSFLEAPPPWQ